MSLSWKELTRSNQQPLPALWHGAPSLLLCMWPCWQHRCQGSWQMLAPSPWPTGDFVCVRAGVCVCFREGWLWLWYTALGLLFLATINTSPVLRDNALAFNQGIWMPGEDDLTLVSLGRVKFWNGQEWSRENCKRTWKQQKTDCYYMGKYIVCRHFWPFLDRSD